MRIYIYIYILYAVGIAAKRGAEGGPDALDDHADAPRKAETGN